MIEVCSLHLHDGRDTGAGEHNPAKARASDQTEVAADLAE
jgi:hypothetical protein